MLLFIIIATSLFFVIVLLGYLRHAAKKQVQQKGNSSTKYVTSTNCPSCHGNGALMQWDTFSKTTKRTMCGRCGGSGQIRR